MNKLFTSLLTLFVFCFASVNAQHYVGGDISLLPEYEKAGAVYKDVNGTIIPDLLPWLKNQGMNAMRVRLFVNPKKYQELHKNDTGSDTKYDPNACQDLEYITPICKKIVDNGMDLMLDFHYSDTWADPAKQWTPIDWENLSDEQLYQKIYDYTKETLETLKSQGIVPAFIQPGNEISYGMLWGKLGSSESSLKKVYMNNNANWDRFGKLLSQAIKACREVCPEAKIVIHTERTAQLDVEKYFYDKMKTMNIDYDIIGLSYYPYFHGKINVLDSSLSMLEANYPEKNIMIVETGYSYAWEVPGTDKPVDYPYSAAGQNQFATALVNTLEKHSSVDGLFWWWMEYNAYSTSLSGWYNAPLFDSRDGKALPALTTICSFAKSSGVTDLPADNSAIPTLWYNLQGQPMAAPDAQSAPGIYISRDKKIIIR